MSGISIISAIISILFVKNKPSDMGQTQDGMVLALNESKNDKVYFSEYDWTVKEAVNTSSFWLITVGSVGLLSSYNVCMAHSTINFMDKGVSPDLVAISMG